MSLMAAPIPLRPLEQHHISISRNEYLALVYTWKISCYSSIALAFLTMVTFLAFRRRFPSNIFLWFVTCSFLLPVTLILSDGSVVLEEAHEGIKLSYPGSWMCRFQALSLQFVGTSMVFWFLQISISLYMVVCVRFRYAASMAKYQHAFTWIPAFLLTAIPAYFGKLGFPEEGLWCWIAERDPSAPPGVVVYKQSSLFEFLFFYSWMGLIGLFSAVIWLRVVVQLVFLMRDPSVRFVSAMKAKYWNFALRTLLVLVIFDVIFLIMFVHRVVQSVTPKPYFWLIYLHLLALCSQGIWIFFAVGLTGNNLKSWFGFLTCKRSRRKSRPPATDF